MKELEEKHKNEFVTPFEKNLQFWRQLWRTMERSHLVCQIVDARNPLLFRCQDIERYAIEMNSAKRCLLVVNKADYLSEKARKIWARYFAAKNINFVFFSAKLSQDQIDQEDEMEQLRLAKEKEEAEKNGVLWMAQNLAKAKLGVGEEGKEEQVRVEEEATGVTSNDDEVVTTPKEKKEVWLCVASFSFINSQFNGGAIILKKRNKKIRYCTWTKYCNDFTTQLI